MWVISCHCGESGNDRTSKPAKMPLLTHFQCKPSSLRWVGLYCYQGVGGTQKPFPKYPTNHFEIKPSRVTKLFNRHEKTRS